MIIVVKVPRPNCKSGDTSSTRLTKIRMVCDLAYVAQQRNYVVCLKIHDMKRILVPCDFSRLAEEAFKFAVKIAEKSKGEIFVLFVIDITFLNGNPTLSHTWAFNLNFVTEMEREGNEKFEAMRRRNAPSNVAVKFIPRIGTLIPDIHRVIIEQEIDLVVMGTHAGEHSVWHSNTEKTLTNIPVPLIALTMNPQSAIRSIVMPVSLDQPNRKFVEEVTRLQSFFNARLNLLWINTPEVFKADTESLKALHKYANEAGLTDYTVNIRSDNNIARGIQHFADEIMADMIAIGTHGWSSIIRFFTGSITRDIVHTINQPVWTVALTHGDKRSHETSSNPLSGIQSSLPGSKVESGQEVGAI